MPFFAENMKALVDGIRSCRKEREEAIAGLTEDTEQALADTRAFVNRVHQEQQAMGDNLRGQLAAHQRQCRQGVQAMRQEHFRQRAEMNRAIREMLGQARNARNDRLHHLRHQFQQAQQALAQDLRQAARFWRER